MPAAAALAALLLAAGCADAPESVAPPPPLVAVARAAPADAGGLELTGEVRARVESDLGFRVTGQIVRRLVDPGQRVAADQPLMTLDPADLDLAARAAQADAIAADARAQRVMADARRVEQLAQGGWVSKAALDAAQREAQAARAQAGAARAAAGQAMNARGYATLRADSAGIVTAVLAQPGQVMAAGAPVVRLARAGALEAAIDVPEAMVRALPPTAIATAAAAPGRVFTARLRDVAGSADPASRTFAARYALADAADLPLGSTVTLRLATGGAGPALAVPIGALSDAGRGPAVWVVDQGKVRRRPVRVAALEDERALLAGGVAEGELVVALGAHLLREGQAVRIAGAPTGALAGVPGAPGMAGGGAR
jgi:RND family efflux transporter MFP subunit